MKTETFFALSENGHKFPAIVVQNVYLNEIVGTRTNELIQTITSFFEDKGFILGSPWKIIIYIDNEQKPLNEDGMLLLGATKTIKGVPEDGKVYIFLKNIEEIVQSLETFVEVLFHELSHVADDFKDGKNAPKYENLPYKKRPHEIKALKIGIQYSKAFFS